MVETASRPFLRLCQSVNYGKEVRFYIYTYKNLAIIHFSQKDIKKEQKPVHDFAGTCEFYQYHAFIVKISKMLIL